MQADFFRDNLLDFFQKCLSAPYITVGDDVDYYVKKVGGRLEIYFESSNGTRDWITNLRFPSLPYKGMDIKYRVHGGFLKSWKSLEDIMLPIVLDTTIKEVIIIGYSHGGALAMLCHEFCWYHRPDLRDTTRTYGFGAPRVFNGWVIPKKLKPRWQNFRVVRNGHDIVTHLPFLILRFRHVGKIIKIGGLFKYGPINSHRPENYINELVIHEKKKRKKLR